MVLFLVMMGLFGNIQLGQQSGFFFLSKVFWLLFKPGNLFLYFFLFLLFFLLIRNLGNKLIIILMAISALAIAVLPVSSFFTHVLETRFEKPSPLPDKITGVVILGGVINPKLSFAREETQINSAIERIVEGVAIAKRYPTSKIIFSGGSGLVMEQKYKEADYAKTLFGQLGLSGSRLIFERMSRNTIENALFSKKIADPKYGEIWLLITSAFHMPRAVGVFRSTGWNVTPYPVDYSTYPDFSIGWNFDFGSGLSSINMVVHEYLGLLVYWITGKTNEFLPGPIWSR